jgi:hypothetical protein
MKLALSTIAIVALSAVTPASAQGWGENQPWQFQSENRRSVNLGIEQTRRGGGGLGAGLGNSPFLSNSGGLTTFQAENVTFFNQIVTGSNNDVNTDFDGNQTSGGGNTQDTDVTSDSGDFLNTSD